MLQEHHGPSQAQLKVWTETSSDTPGQAPCLVSPRLLCLPVWTDTLAQAAFAPDKPDTPAAVQEPAISLPQHITWQRIPEPMVIKFIRLHFAGQHAAEILEGVVCGFSISDLTPSHSSGDKQQQAATRQLQLRPESLAVLDDSVLSAEAELPVGVDECVSISTVRHVCRPGDSLYLASWSKLATSQTFTDDQ